LELELENYTQMAIQLSRIPHVILEYTIPPIMPFVNNVLPQLLELHFDWRTGYNNDNLWIFIVDIIANAAPLEGREVVLRLSAVEFDQMLMPTLWIPENDDRDEDATLVGFMLKYAKLLEGKGIHLVDQAWMDYRGVVRKESFDWRTPPLPWHYDWLY
jgi:hypothetical protein